MRKLAPVLRDLLAAGEPAALVTIAGARGSTPRELGTRMLVTPERFFGTIGGGRLEYDAIGEARRMLVEGGSHLLREVPLGPALGQCCGGHATVLIERARPDHLDALDALDAGGPGFLLTRLDRAAPTMLLEGRVAAGREAPPAGFERAVERLLEGAGRPERVTHPDGSSWLIEPTMDDAPEVFVFGAGHVGRALAAALQPLPCRMRLFDHRPELLRELPEGCNASLTEHPTDRVLEARPQAFFLVMTPSHDVDCDICEAVLRRGDFAFLGLIGSSTKRARFEKRWRAKGIAEASIRRLVCPIGLPGIGGKEPAVIAASTAAQLLQAFEQTPHPVPWAERRV
ncbi:MAG TPA: xanthine dehydrogenase accessory protein XdhC [Geminicoccaceae bacterium]